MRTKLISVLGIALMLGSVAAEAQSRSNKRFVCRGGEVQAEAVVIANAFNSPNITLGALDLYKAFAHQVVIQGRLVKNPYKKWSDINSALPRNDIEALGPPPGSPIRQLLIEVGLENGAMEYEPLKTLREFPDTDKGRADAKAAAIAMGISNDCLGADYESRTGEQYFKCIVHELRRDGGWVNAGNNSHAIVATLQQVPMAVGIFDYSYLKQNADKIKGAVVLEVEPNEETIVSGEYPLTKRTCIRDEKNKD